MLAADVFGEGWIKARVRLGVRAPRTPSKGPVLTPSEHPGYLRFAGALMPEEDALAAVGDVLLGGNVFVRSAGEIDGEPVFARLDPLAVRPVDGHALGEMILDEARDLPSDAL